MLLWDLHSSLWSFNGVYGTHVIFLHNKYFPAINLNRQSTREKSQEMSTLINISLEAIIATQSTSDATFEVMK